MVDGNWAQRLGDAERMVEYLDERLRGDWRAPEDQRVRIACEDARLVTEFVGRLLNEKEVDDFIITAVRQDKDYVDAFELIGWIAHDFDSSLDAIGQSGSQDKLVERLVGKADELRQALQDAVSAFIAVVNERTANDRDVVKERSKALRVADDIRRQLQARHLIHEVEQAAHQARQARDDTLRVRDRTKRAVDEALGARDQAEKTAGDAGADLLGKYHAEYAKREAHIANWLRWLAAGLLIVVAAGAVWFNYRLGEASLVTELVRLSATLPVAALAAYLVRESSKHRKSADWAHGLAIAMHTLPIYTEPLDADGRELRRVLGMRVFGPAADKFATSSGDSPDDDPSKALAKLEELLRRGLDIVERRPGNQ